QSSLSSAICRPPGFGGASDSHLDGGADGGTESVGGRVRDVAGGHGDRASRGALALWGRWLPARFWRHADHRWDGGDFHGATRREEPGRARLVDARRGRRSPAVALWRTRPLCRHARGGRARNWHAKRDRDSLTRFQNGP